MPLVPLLRTLTSPLPRPLPFFYLEAMSKPSQMIDPLIEETDLTHRRLYKEVVNKKTLKHEIQVALSSLCHRTAIRRTQTSEDQKLSTKGDSRICLSWHWRQKSRCSRRECFNCLVKTGAFVNASSHSTLILFRCWNRIAGFARQMDMIVQR